MTTFPVIIIANEMSVQHRSVHKLSHFIEIVKKLIATESTIYYYFISIYPGTLLQSVLYIWAYHAHIKHTRHTKFPFKDIIQIIKKIQTVTIKSKILI